MKVVVELEIVECVVNDVVESVLFEVMLLYVLQILVMLYIHCGVHVHEDVVDVEELAEDETVAHTPSRCWMRAHALGLGKGMMMFINI